MLKMIILPRQARDKHRDSTQKETRFFAGVEGSPLARCDAVHQLRRRRAARRRELCLPSRDAVQSHVDIGRPLEGGAVLQQLGGGLHVTRCADLDVLRHCRRIRRAPVRAKHATSAAFCNAIL